MDSMESKVKFIQFVFPGWEDQKCEHIKPVNSYEFEFGNRDDESELD